MTPTSAANADRHISVSLARAPRRGLLESLLATFATFIGSFLLFSMEPYVGKLLLPSFGGTPLLWNTCMVFYQVALLCGYGYAQVLTRNAQVRTQVILQLVLLVGIFWLYPSPERLVTVVGDHPAMTLVATLARAVLIPFAVLAALTTLVQWWFAATSWDRTGSPYWLYAASNIGSLLGLFAYPLVLEPVLPLSQQHRFFRIVLAALVAVISAFGLVTLRTISVSPQIVPISETAQKTSNDFGLRSWLQVMSLAAIPSSLLLGVTNYILTDVASLPLFWVLPLALYLLTFILAFGVKRSRTPVLLPRLYSLLAIFTVVALSAEATSPPELLIPCHLVVFVVAAYLCHSRIATLAPSPRNLGVYYLALSLGGAVGGTITLLVPPLITNRMVEYPLALIASSIVVGTAIVQNRSRAKWMLDAVVPGALVYVVATVLWKLSPSTAYRWTVLAYAPAALFALGANTSGSVFSVRLLSLYVGSIFLPSLYGTTLFAERRFYGRVRVTRDEEKGAHQIVHGSTVHGLEMVRDMRGCVPVSYYHATGPAGRYLSTLPEISRGRRVALIGLGSGALACYARATDSWEFFELDPVVARVARDTTLFTYLAHSNARSQRIHLGDARTAISRVAETSYDIIIVDAFSSDAIPIHLLTKEAIELYVRALRPGGTLLFHISNRFFQLRRVLAGGASALGLSAYDNSDLLLTEAQFVEGKFASEWVAIVPDSAEASLGAGWTKVSVGNQRIWTDDYSNPLGALQRNVSITPPAPRH